MEKHLFLIAGPSGSGKSTIAKVIAPAANVAADDFMVDSNGNYEFRGEKLGYCHHQCGARVSMWMGDGVSPIAVHNTFTKKRDKEPYLKLAKSWGYTVHHIIADGDYQDTHQVPEFRKEAQASGFQFNNRYMRETRRNR